MFCDSTGFEEKLTNHCITEDFSIYRSPAFEHKEARASVPHGLRLSLIMS